VPYEDNIVKQLLSEYEESLQLDTPAHGTPHAPYAKGRASEKPAEVPAGAHACTAACCRL
jgi:hypothetical protein